MEKFGGSNQPGKLKGPRDKLIEEVFLKTWLNPPAGIKRPLLKNFKGQVIENADVALPRVTQQIYVWLRTGASVAADDLQRFAKAVMDAAQQKARVEEAMNALGISGPERVRVQQTIDSPQFQRVQGTPLAASRIAAFGRQRSDAMDVTDPLQAKAKKVLKRMEEIKTPKLFALSQSYTEVGTNLLLKTDRKDRLEKIDAATCANSHGGFNPDYGYSERLGAFPKKADLW